MLSLLTTSLLFVSFNYLPPRYIISPNKVVWFNLLQHHASCSLFEQSPMARVQGVHVRQVDESLFAHSWSCEYGPVRRSAMSLLGIVKNFLRPAAAGRQDGARNAQPAPLRFAETTFE